MPIFDLFNRPALQLSYPVSPLQIIASNDHNTLLLENRNQQLYTENNADTSTGGIGIESHYIANSAITSSKMNLQMANVSTANRKVKSNNFIPNGATWQSPDFGFFTIVWEKPFMTAMFDYYSKASMDMVIANPLNQSFFARIEMWANTTSGQVLFDNRSFDYFDGDFKPRRRNYGQDIGLSANVADNGSFQIVQTMYSTPTFTNTTGQASNSFFFRAFLTNETTPAASTWSSQNNGSCIVDKLRYITTNQIHS